MASVTVFPPKIDSIALIGVVCLAGYLEFGDKEEGKYGEDDSGEGDDLSSISGVPVKAELATPDQSRYSSRAKDKMERQGLIESKDPKKSADNGFSNMV